jgi:hypothetical protein
MEGEDQRYDEQKLAVIASHEVGLGYRHAILMTFCKEEPHMQWVSLEREHMERLVREAEGRGGE